MPMVRSDAALSHLGIRHVCVCLLGIIGHWLSPLKVGDLCSFHRTRGSHLRHVRMGNKAMPFVGLRGWITLTERKSRLELQWILMKVIRGIMNSTSRKRVFITRE